MALNENQRAALRAELTGDPLVRGYGAMADAAVLASLTAVDRTRPRSVVPTWEVLAAIDAGEWTAGQSGLDKQTLTAVTGTGVVDPNNARIVALLAGVFSGGGWAATRTNMQALQTEAIDRLGELGLSLPSEHEIAVARS